MAMTTRTLSRSSAKKIAMTPRTAMKYAPALGSPRKPVSRPG